ncbi:hypothetical protein K443DRAFT_682446 [Laccaria amethystina LaAM-08-1]|uniref:C2H2-type domain-containing protein n=1 Tax=Laccaria amethystina LaAM-08-1 TaxID=1095629 RepID=A0A0C9WV08_9AGAR|nr:hypothetical protein K443DRAFT_682446 [Laccaria amethystina LaAM-08-1]
MPLSANAIDVCNLLNLMNNSADSVTVSDTTQSDSDIKAVLEGLENPRVVQAIARGLSNLTSNFYECAMSPPMPPIMPINQIEAGHAQTNTTTNALRVGGIAPHATLPGPNYYKHYRPSTCYFPSTPTFAPSIPQSVHMQYRWIVTAPGFPFEGPALSPPRVELATPQLTATTLKRSASTAFSTNSDSATFGVYPCGWQNCGHLFTISHRFAEDLRTHLRETHHLGLGITDPLIACQWSSCKLTEKISASALVTHVIGPHMRLTNQGCKFCGMELSGIYALSRHFQTCKKAKKALVAPAPYASKRVRVK